MVVIKDMEMPSSCYDCPFAKNERTNDYGSFCECGILEDCKTINLLEHSKHSNCPLIEQEPILDKIRGEIEKLEYLNIEDGSDGYDKYIERYEVLKIIDKYRTEREGEA